MMASGGPEIVVTEYSTPSPPPNPSSAVRSDWIGRRPVVGLGLLLFAIGCFLSIVADDLTVMLAGRFLQGAGLAGPRVVVVEVGDDVDLPAGVLGHVAAHVDGAGDAEPGGLVRQ